MKRAFLVWGPESSGTRLLTRILCHAGCTGDPGHSQPWDEAEPDADLIVWRRSWPHGFHKGHRASSIPWPDGARIIQELRGLDYDVTVLVLARFAPAMVESQIARRHVNTEAEAIANIRGAYARIFESLSQTGATFHVVPYESLERNHLDLCRFLGLDDPLGIGPVENRNRDGVLT